MSIVVRLSPTNVTRDKYDEVASRLESAGMWPNPDGLDYHVLFGSEGTSASARSGILESSSRRSESTSCPSSPTLESGSPPNRRYSRFTTSPSARNAPRSADSSVGLRAGQHFYSVLGVEAAARTRKWTLSPSA